MSALAAAGRAGRAGPRRGATLIELLAATALAGTVGAAAATVLVRQLRFYRDAARLADGRQQVDGGLALLPADLRAASPRDGDLTAIAPDAVQLRATVAAAVACDAPDSATLDFPPAAPESRAPLASWGVAPRAGDTLVVYTPGDSARAAAWTAHAVRAFDASGGRCAGSALVAAADAAGPRARLTVDAATPLPAGAGEGTAVRVLRHVRYTLYTAGDGRRYLGFSDYGAGTGWAGVQPVSGPYAAGDAPRARAAPP